MAAARPTASPDRVQARSACGWGGATLVMLASAAVATIGADLLWAARLGSLLVRHGFVHGVPFAAAPSSNWPNALALGEISLHAVMAVAGLRGLLIAQVLAVAGCMTVLVRDAASLQARPAAMSLATTLVGVGAITSLGIARLQLFSLLLFPVVVLLLRAQHRCPDRSVWFLPPLLALWANLHGAVLVGALVAGFYLALSRARQRPVETLAVTASCGLAMCLTPALWRTPRYDIGLLVNEAAREGHGVWAPPALTSPFDLATIAVAITMAWWTVRYRGPAWELATGVVLAIGFAHATRSGLWLLLFLAPPAAAGLRDWAPAALAGRGRWILMGAPVALALAAWHTPQVDPLVRQAVTLSGPAGVIVADDVLGEDVAVMGGTVWVVNPLDAYPRTTQRTFLAWAQGSPTGDNELSHATCAVLVTPGSPPAHRLMVLRQFRLINHDLRAQLWARPSCELSQ